MDMPQKIVLCGKIQSILVATLLLFLGACALSNATIDKPVSGDLFLSQIALLPVRLPIAQNNEFPVSSAGVANTKKIRSILERPLTAGAFKSIIEEFQTLDEDQKKFVRFSGDFMNQGIDPVNVSLYFSKKPMRLNQIEEKSYFIGSFTLLPNRATSVDELRDFDTPPETVKENLFGFFEALDYPEQFTAYLIAESKQPIKVFCSLSLIAMPPIHISSILSKRG